MKQLRKIKIKINTLLINKTYAYAEQIKKIEAKKHTYNTKDKLLMRARVDALRDVVGELLSLRNLINSAMDQLIYEGIVE